MAIETEIKLRLPQGPEHIRAILEQLGFRPTGPHQLESDQTFDLPSGELRQSGRLLRLRSAGGLWTVTYKGPPQGGDHKSREEIESAVSDGAAFTEILARLGYQPSFAYEKFRTLYRAPGDDGIIALDETPIGDFLELEGPGYWIDRTALVLGFNSADYITGSYAALYSDYRRARESTEGKPVPRNMQFQRP